MNKKLTYQIEELWKNYSKLIKNTEEFKSARKIVRVVINELDNGKIRVCSKSSSRWQTHEWVKKAILLSFLMHDSEIISAGYTNYYDKIPPKFTIISEEEDFKQNEIRVTPGSYVRKGVYLGKNVIIMPAFVNIGAYIDDNTMIDSLSTIGSCAQIGKECHISSNTVIGGVLEPLQSQPVIIEDKCFVGANSVISEGTFISEGCVIGAGVILTSSTKIINNITGEINYGFVPPYSVVVPGTLPNKSQPELPSVNCAVIIKQVDSQTRQKTSLNELLRY